MKGGVVNTLSDGDVNNSNSNDVMFSFLINSNISILTDDSLTCITYKCKLNDSTNSNNGNNVYKSPYVSCRSQTLNEPINCILLKVFLLADKDETDKTDKTYKKTLKHKSNKVIPEQIVKCKSYEIPIQKFKRHRTELDKYLIRYAKCSTIEEVQEEVKIQSDIYNKSYKSVITPCDAICPDIINVYYNKYDEITESTEITEITESNVNTPSKKIKINNSENPTNTTTNQIPNNLHNDNYLLNLLLYKLELDEREKIITEKWFSTANTTKYKEVQKIDGNGIDVDVDVDVDVDISKLQKGYIVVAMEFMDGYNTLEYYKKQYDKNIIDIDKLLSYIRQCIWIYFILVCVCNISHNDCHFGNIMFKPDNMYFIGKLESESESESQHKNQLKLMGQPLLIDFGKVSVIPENIETTFIKYLSLLKPNNKINIEFYLQILNKNTKSKIIFDEFWGYLIYNIPTKTTNTPIIQELKDTYKKCFKDFLLENNLDELTLLRVKQAKLFKEKFKIDYGGSEFDEVIVKNPDINPKQAIYNLIESHKSPISGGFKKKIHKKKINKIKSNKKKTFKKYKSKKILQHKINAKNKK